MSLKVGDTATRSRMITDEDVRAFAELTGDHNPVHLDDEYAAGTRFGRRVAHGMLAASLISATLANDLPGRGTVYLSQQLQFTAPVFPGDEVKAHVSVLKVREDKPVVTLATVCTNQRGETVVRGEAVVMLTSV